MATAMPRYRALLHTKNHSEFTFANLRCSTLGAGRAGTSRLLVAHHVCRANARGQGRDREIETPMACWRYGLSRSLLSPLSVL